MTVPSVSIVTPSFNQASYIGDTIRSVAGQKGVQIEHIVVDGGSTDGTVTILENLESDFEFKWVSEHDQGQADAINKGFRRSSGDILGWLNSDDVYLRCDAIQTMLSYFDKYPDVDIISGSGIRLNADGNWSRPIQVRRDKFSHSHLKYFDPVLQPATLWRREVWECYNLDPELRFTFDWDFFYRASAKFNILPIPERIAGYRMSGENKTARNPPSRMKEVREQLRRNVGERSGEYVVLSTLSRLQALGRLLPGTLLANLWQGGIHKTSGLVSLLFAKRDLGM